MFRSVKKIIRFFLFPVFFRPTDPKKLQKNPCYEKLNWCGLTSELSPIHVFQGEGDRNSSACHLRCAIAPAHHRMPKINMRRAKNRVPTHRKSLTHD